MQLISTSCDLRQSELTAGDSHVADDAHRKEFK
jgi:hypothetical protein